MKRNEHLVMFFKINKKKKKFFFLTCGIPYPERLEMSPKKKRNEQLVMLVNKKKLKKILLITCWYHVHSDLKNRLKKERKTNS
jgi:hypothetical protein